jgi:uncharacterized protein (DUF58 family)
MSWWQSWTNYSSASDKADSNLLTQEYLQQAEYIAHLLRNMLVQARSVASGAMMGTVQSWIKGQGVQFAGVRAYSDADDARLIDWNTTARLQSPMVRYATEERNNDVHILVDVSASMMTGIGAIPMHPALMTALSIMCVVDHAGDAFSVLAYNPAHSAPMKLCSPLGKGDPHLMRSATCLVHEILRGYESISTSQIHRHTEPESSHADTLHLMLRDAVAVLRKRSILFFISDGQTSLSKKTLQALVPGALRKHDCVFMRIHSHNQYAQTLHAGFADAELGHYTTGSWQEQYQSMAEHSAMTQVWLEEVGMRVIAIADECEIESVLRTLFRRKR